MPRLTYTASEYTDMILIYGECRGNAALALRTYRERYGDSRNCPRNARTIQLAVQRLRDNKRVVPQQEGVPPRQIPAAWDERILDHFSRNPTTSLHRAARQFRCCHRTIHKVLKRNKRKPYKYRKVQALLSRDLPIRNSYCQWLLNKTSEDRHFLTNVIWTDECTFTRNGIWNRQNLRYWSLGNPHVFRESEHQYRFSLNVWAGIHNNNIIGPVFIDGTLTAAKFLDLLSGPVAEYTDQLPLAVHRKLWYQLDGAPPHSVMASRERLTEMFGQQWIGRFGPVRWPPRSPDLTPMDFFLWGYIKGEVYASEVNTIVELKNRIILAFHKLKCLATDSDLIRKLNNNILRRYNLCINVNGGHIENLKI